MNSLPLTSLPERPPRTEGEELLHSLRNILAAMTYGMQALGAAHTEGDQPQFHDIQAAMNRQVNRLTDSVAQADKLLKR